MQDEMDVQLLAIDPHESWAAKALLKEVGLTSDDVNFPLLLDPSLTVSATYGLANQMRIHVEVSNRPGAFIIDKSGVLRYAKTGKTFGDRPGVTDIVAELKKLEE
jgi:peroxiredoxin